MRGQALLQRLEDEIVVGDGAMGTMLYARGVAWNACPEKEGGGRRSRGLSDGLCRGVPHDRRVGRGAISAGTGATGGVCHWGELLPI